MRRAGRLASVALGATALALGGCGGDEGGGGGEPAKSQEGEPSGKGQTIELSADPGGALEFDKTQLKAKAGEVTINFDNPSSIPHAVEVEGNGVEEETTTVTSAKAKLSVDLKAGEYEFYCPVGNHKEQGMEGTLIVS